MRIRLTFWREKVVNSLANHLADDRAVVIRPIVKCLDMGAVTKNRNAICKGFDFVKPVRDEKHTYAAVTFGPDQVKDLFNN